MESPMIGADEARWLDSQRPASERYARAVARQVRDGVLPRERASPAVLLLVIELILADQRRAQVTAERALGDIQVLLARAL